VAAIVDLVVLDEEFARPDGFDLAKTWTAWAEQFERNLFRDEAVIRLSPAGVQRIPYLIGRAMARGAQNTVGPPEADGWVRATVPIESVPHAHGELLRLGSDVEVLEPAELRELMRSTAVELAALYGDAPSPAPAGDAAAAAGDAAGDAAARTSGSVR
jgi:predicted DNA-binding transcriptional regulator YafY